MQEISAKAYVVMWNISTVFSISQDLSFLYLTNDLMRLFCVATWSDKRLLPLDRRLKGSPGVLSIITVKLVSNFSTLFIFTKIFNLVVEILAR